MKLKINADIKEVSSALSGMSRQIPYAQSLLVNRLGDGAIKQNQSVMPSAIDRPTRFTLNSMFLAKGSKSKPVATIGFKDIPKRSSHYLEPLIKGGSRHRKGTEVAFGNRWFAPGKAAQELGYIDQYGNFKPSMLQQLRSYFGKAELSSGYTANSKRADREKLAKMKRTINGRKVTAAQQMKGTNGYLTIGGKVFFMSLGRGSGALGKQHLAAGVWQKSGVHGVDVKPVLMQVRQPQYRKQYDFYGITVKWVNDNSKRIGDEVLADVLRSAR